MGVAVGAAAGAVVAEAVAVAVAVEVGVEEGAGVAPPLVPVVILRWTKTQLGIKPHRARPSFPTTRSASSTTTTRGTSVTLS